MLRLPLALAAAFAALPICAQAAIEAGLEGNWIAEQTNSDGMGRVEATLIFTGNRGVMRVGADDWPLFEVKRAGGKVAFTLIIPGTPYVSIHYAGMLDGDDLKLASLDPDQPPLKLDAHRAPIGEPPVVAPPVMPASEIPPVTTAPMPDVMRPAMTVETPSAAPAPVEKPSLPPLRDLVPNNLALAPPMGWASREKLGAMVDDEAIRQAAEGLDVTGLRALGYVTVEVDDGWQGARDGNGVLHGNQKFPDMKALGDAIHARGLKFGLQTAAGPKSCGGFDGSYGHEIEDAKTLASWGVDYLVYDWCGADSIYLTQPEQQAAYQKMAEALRASGREIVFAANQGGRYDVAQWGAKAGVNVWRTGGDIDDRWASITEAGFAQGGKDTFAGPGHWGDPGLLQAGNGGMTADEYRTQLNLWAILAAPMMLGNDVRIMTRDTLTLLTNQEVIAVDQDPLGSQGKRVAKNGDSEVWARPLADGSVAVAFFNRGNQSAPVAVSWAQLGIDGLRNVRDLWWHRNIGRANGRYVVFLTGHTSLLLRMSP